MLIHRVHSFGCQLGDINLANLSTLESKELKRLLNKYQLIIIKNQSLSLIQQTELTRKLGEIELAWEDKHPESDYVQYLSNRKRTYPSFKSSSKYWHSDRSFCKTPSRYTFLQAIEISTGSASTNFCDMRSAYTTLPCNIKSLCNELTAVHAFDYKFPEIMRRKGFSESIIQKHLKMYSDVIHPLVKKNKDFNYKALYLNELTICKIVELNYKESRKLLNLLYCHSLLNSDFQYNHHWDKGDFLIWDNESLIHRASRKSSNGARELFRTTTSSMNSDMK